MLPRYVWIIIISFGIFLTSSILVACKERFNPNQAPTIRTDYNFEYQKFTIEGKEFIYIHVPNTSVHQILPFTGELK